MIPKFLDVGLAQEFPLNGQDCPDGDGLLLRAKHQAAPGGLAGWMPSLAFVYQLSDSVFRTSASHTHSFVPPFLSFSLGYLDPVPSF
jgi:hypothetical protein